MDTAEHLSEIDPTIRNRCPIMLSRWLGNVSFDPSLSELNKEKLVGILSSHSKRNQFANSWWQRRMQAALKIAKARNARVLFAADSPSAEAIRHTCIRFSVRYAEIQTEESNAKQPIITNRLGRVIRIYSHRDTIDPSLANTTISDRTVAFLSDILIAIHVRPKGKLLRILEERISEKSIPSGSTWLAMHPMPSNSQRSTEQYLSDAGAVLWMFHGERPEDVLAGGTSPWGCLKRHQPATLAPVLKAQSLLLESNNYLIHCTRSRQGPWPDQSIEGFLDEALLLEVHEPSTPAGTLARILTQQRIAATNRLKRGQLSTSCWSACPLGELLSRRSFQNHLGRWDWEPFGIAIRTERLMQLGSRPVTYLRAESIGKLPSEDQSFAQPAPNQAGDRDWREEKEWRIAGDLRLHSIGFSDAFVFTPDMPTAMQMAPISRWPVCFIK